jgi:hypothetical protein
VALLVRSCGLFLVGFFFAEDLVQMRARVAADTGNEFPEEPGHEILRSSANICTFKHRNGSGKGDKQSSCLGNKRASPKARQFSRFETSPS